MFRGRRGGGECSVQIINVQSVPGLLTSIVDGKIASYFVVYSLILQKLVTSVIFTQEEDTETLLAADFEIGHFMRERLIPRVNPILALP